MGSGNGQSAPNDELFAATLRIADQANAARPEDGEEAPVRRLSPRAALAIHASLYLATLVTTYLAGGAMFAATLMAILTVHEGGHYYFARRHGVPASLPFFVPFPYSPFGTMGAVIAMPAQIPNRRALLDIGAAGPIAGFALALPALIVGMVLSHVSTVPAVTGEWVFGDSLLVRLVGALFGPANPDDAVMVLHPIGFAGYVGCLVTAFNLIPVGQLDGGHALHAFLGRRPVPPLVERAAELRRLHREATRALATTPGAAWGIRLRAALLARLAPLAEFAASSWPRAIGTAVVMGLVLLGALTPWKGWWLWAVLLVVLGIDHPRTRDEIEPLDRRRALLALVCLAIFVLTFVPVPVQQLP